MPVSASDSAGSDLSGYLDVTAAKPLKGTGVFMPRSATGSRVVLRPQAAAHTGTQQQHQHQQQDFSRSFSGGSMPLGRLGKATNISCSNCNSHSSSILVPVQSSVNAAAWPMSIADSSSVTSVSSSRPYVQDQSYHHYNQQQQQLQQQQSALIAAQYAAAAAASLTPPYEDEQDDLLYLDSNYAGFTDPADGDFGFSPEAGSDDLLFAPGSLLSGGSFTCPTNSSSTAPTNSSSSMMQPGHWPVSAPLPPPRQPSARDLSRGASQLLPRPRSASVTGYGFVPQQQQLETAPDQLLGSSYQQQMMMVQQLQQQLQLAGGSVSCSPCDEFDGEVYLAGCCSPAGVACASISSPVNNSSSFGMTGQQQQQAMRLHGRISSSNSSPLPSLPCPAMEQQLHSQIGSSSSTVALQPLLNGSRSSSQELQAVHAINAQLQQLLKMKEEVLVSKAAAAAAAAAAAPMPPASAAKPGPAATGVYAPAPASDLSPMVCRMHSSPGLLEHSYVQQQQQLFGLDLQPQQQLQGASCGSAGAMHSSYHVAPGMQAGIAANQLPADSWDVSLRGRSSSNGSSIRMDQRHVVGSWAGDGRSNGQLCALEQARQKHAARAATEHKLQQLAAVQRMQLDLQQEILQMLN